MSNSKKYKTKTLSLSEKVNVIEESNNLSVKQLANMFEVGKSQIYNILKNRGEILNAWESGIGGQIRRNRSSNNEEINEAVWEWFLSARLNNFPISGPILQAQAMEVARELGVGTFKASNGWLESFRSRHNIVFKRSKICGEANDVTTTSYAGWKDKLLKITTFQDAHKAVNNLEQFFALKNRPELLDRIIEIKLLMMKKKDME